MIISILIATLDRAHSLNQTLSSLNCIHVPPEFAIEIIIVDNGSNDGTSAIVETFAAGTSVGAVVFLRETRRGKSAALNTGLNACRGDIIIFIDDDVRPTADWLLHITAPIKSNNSDAVGGSVQIAPHLLRPWMTASHLAWLASTHYVNAENPEYLVGANMAISRAVLQKVGGFDTELGPGKLGLWEDSLFTARLKKAGYRIKFSHEAVVEHHFDESRLTRKAFLSHAERQGRSSGYVDWHWHHHPSTFQWHQTLHYQLRLAIKRVLRFRACLRVDRIEVWEMDLVCGIARNRQLVIERRREPNYDECGRPTVVRYAYNEMKGPSRPTAPSLT